MLPSSYLIHNALPFHAAIYSRHNALPFHAAIQLFYTQCTSISCCNLSILYTLPLHSILPSSYFIHNALPFHAAIYLFSTQCLPIPCCHLICLGYPKCPNIPCWHLCPPIPVCHLSSIHRVLPLHAATFSIHNALSFQVSSLLIFQSL